MRNQEHLFNPEFLIITFTIVLLILGFTIIFMFLFIQKQKQKAHLLSQEIKAMNINQKAEL